MDYNKTEQHAIVSVLIAIMEADGVIHPNETVYLNKVLSTFSITESEIEEIQVFDPIITPRVLKEMPQDKRDEARQLFIGMAECDGFTDPREIEIIKTVV